MCHYMCIYTEYFSFHNIWYIGIVIFELFFIWVLLDQAETLDMVGDNMFA